MICANCLYRDKTDMNLSFTEQGLCAGCINCKIAKNLDWKKVQLLVAIIYLNMSPLHDAPFDKYLFALAQLNFATYFNEN